ncbi:nitronate monooxygenase family protein [Halobacillus sp. A5]|uniref:NAD(P)H-dependent flavin oxidoreductase n=1 Tax=Halobacillus sp. A5 TaxID=2880263 RepID=UPI0020A64009|nr:nitronate monooxygenase [Halobacillus sp. A5]MCP3028440.1 nitronate monooxygenase [Halobacillus sp. A5]
MWISNKLMKLLQMDVPVIQAGMAGGITTPELIAAVSNAGGLGNLGAGYMKAEDMKDSIQKVKQMTKRSFGVNVFIPEYPEIIEEELQRANAWLEPLRKELKIKEVPKPKISTALYAQQIDVLLEQLVPVCSFTFGVPSKEVVHELKKSGIRVIGTATTVEEAVVNEDRGVEAVVVQGSEAGGHRGTFLKSGGQPMIGSMSLVPQAADEVDIPVIAAGGIMDGRGVAAALTLGAEAAQLGTAFVTAEESGAFPEHKEAILQANEQDVEITSAFSGKPARGIRNSFIEKMNIHETDWPAYPIQNSLTKDIRKEAAVQHRAEYMSLWSGQSPRLSTSKAAGDLVAGIAKEVMKLR